MHDLIEKWAQQKDFEQLNTREREQVLAEMSAENYNDLHRMLKALPGLHATAEAPDSILEKSLLALKTKRALPFWQRPVSLGRAAAVALPLLLLAWFRAPVRVQVIEKTAQQYHTVHDTIVRHDTLWKTRVFYRKIRVPEVPILTTEPIATLPFRVLDPGQSIDSIAVLFAQPDQNGSALSEHPELLDFFVQPDK